MSYAINGPADIGDTGQLTNLHGDVRLSDITSSIGDLVYADASNNLAALPLGSDGYVLQSNGPGFAPSWVVQSTGTTYDAVVSTSGAPGTYPLLSAAISDGKLNIYIEEGTYVETSQIVLPEQLNITGVNIRRVNLVFSGLAVPALSLPSSGALTVTGTISAVNGSPTITGVGTNFLTLSPGNLIFVGSLNFTIASIATNLSLTLTVTYRGKNVTNAAYVAFQAASSVSVSRVSILNNPGSPCTSSAISIVETNGVKFDTVLVYGFVNNVSLNLCSTVVFDSFFSRYSVGYGLLLQDVLNCTMTNSGCFNCSGIGLSITSSTYQSLDINIDQCFFLSNGSRGFDSNGQCAVINLTNSIFQYNNSDGIRCNNTTSNVLISQCNVKNNTLGINYSGNNNSVTGCIITNNTGGGITTGNQALITGNVVSNNTGIGIDMGSDQDCTVTGNIVNNNTSHGISVSGNTQACSITGNSLFSNAGNGINITGAASGDNSICSNAIRNSAIGITLSSDDNVVSGNRVDQCTSGIIVQLTADRTVVSGNNLHGNTTNYTDLGSGTVATGNVTV